MHSYQQEEFFEELWGMARTIRKRYPQRSVRYLVQIIGDVTEAHDQGWLTALLLKLELQIRGISVSIAPQRSQAYLEKIRGVREQLGILAHDAGESDNIEMKALAELLAALRQATGLPDGFLIGVAALCREFLIEKQPPT